METLTRPSSRVLAGNCRVRDRELSFLAPREVLARPEVRWFSSRKRVVGFSQSIFLRPNSIHPVSVSSLSSSSETQKQLLDEATQIQDTKTARVKFQLRKKCAFGEQFYIVGDDPVLGSWDPIKAVPLDWSEGHIWTVEMDVPNGKLIQFKFILKERTGKFLWQPDPDRILQTRETKNMISVSEDWDDAELQILIEEEPSSNVEKPQRKSDKEVVAENLTQPRALMADVNEEPVTNDTATNHEVKPATEKPISIVAENISDPVKEPWEHMNEKVSGAENPAYDECKPILISDKDVDAEDSILGSNRRAVTLKRKEGITEEGNLVSSEGEPVLVPGLTSLMSTFAGKETLSEIETDIGAKASPSADKDKEQNVPEQGVKKDSNYEPLHLNNLNEIVFNNEGLPDNQGAEKVHITEEQDQANLKPPENNVLPITEEQDQANSSPAEDNLLENDIQWGRRTLQKLLSGFGFI
ncbi:Glucan 1,4-alpha-glucosidase [Bertholletia excelsa]